MSNRKNSRHWQIQRTLLELPNAQQRWDRAFQALLQWNLSCPPPSTQLTGTAPVALSMRMNEKEVANHDLTTHSPLCQSFDPAPGPEPDYSSTARTLT